MPKRKSRDKRPPDISMRRRAYLHIQNQIATGQLASGMPVSELALASELNCSRTPIREAMGQLAAEGLLVPAANGSTVVVQLTREDIVEIYELREALEVYAAGKASKHPIRPEERQRLEAFTETILKLKEQLEASGDPYLNDEQMTRFVAADFGFHAMLVLIAGNSRIQKIVNGTRLLIRIFAMRRSGHSAEALTKIHQQHAEILDAMVKQDTPRAMRALAAHIQESMQERLEEFDRWKREAAIQEHYAALLGMESTLMPR